MLLLHHNPGKWRPRQELRIRQHPVLYDVDEHAARVRIVAVGYKEHHKLFIGEEEFEL